MTATLSSIVVHLSGTKRSAYFFFPGRCKSIQLSLQTIRTHTKFVQDVRYSPSGDHFVSVGSDSKIFIYDGKTGDTVAKVSDSPHTGSIVSLLCNFSSRPSDLSPRWLLRGVQTANPSSLLPPTALSSSVCPFLLLLAFLLK